MSGVIEWWVGFHPRDTVAGALRKRSWTVFGHVEAWGMTGEGAWLFYDPRAEGTQIWITSVDDEVDRLMGQRIATCLSILNLGHAGRSIRLPLHPMMTCAAQVGHLFGVRAYVPRTLHRKLTAIGAREVLQHEAEGGPRGP